MCILDATFFGREYGYLSFHDTHQIFYAKEIKTESLAELNFSLDELVLAGYKFKFHARWQGRLHFCTKKEVSRGGGADVCFASVVIVRRYITTNPKTDCGRDLKHIMEGILQDNSQEFLGKFIALKNKHKSFLAQKNNGGKFTHKRLHSAIRSIETNMPLLFQYKHNQN